MTNKTVTREAPGGGKFLGAPLRFAESTVELFTSTKFRIHRLWGLVYLLQFSWAFVLELAGKQPEVFLFASMPLTGFIQTIIACRTFTFLPRMVDHREQGYYHKTRAMSYDFIAENLYFSGLLLFQSVYLCFPDISKDSRFLPLELVGVFFPYHLIRGYFPKSSFRNSIREGTTWTQRYAKIVKVFYVIAKHFSGFYVNYLCFLGAFGEEPVHDWALIRKLLLLGGWGTTIAMFLQTLKFKRYIGANLAAVLYAGSFPFFYMCYAALIKIAMERIWLTAMTLTGLAVNFGPRWAQLVWQIVMCATLLAIRFDGFSKLGCRFPDLAAMLPPQLFEASVCYA